MALAHGLADVSFIKEQRVLSSLFFVRITPHSLHLPLAELNTRSGPVWSNCQIWSDCPLVLLLEMAHSTVTVLNISQVAGVSSISSKHFYILFFLGSSQTRPEAVTARAASTAATIFKKCSTTLNIASTTLLLAVRNNVVHSCVRNMQEALQTIQDQKGGHAL